MIIYSFVASNPEGDEEEGGKSDSLWDRDWQFYCGVSTPCILGLALSNLLATSFNLKKPERVTVSVECCYQNTGIATSVALVMFEGSERSDAVGVPLFYGIVEALILGLYCFGAWRIGWTKAPADESFCIVVGNSYEVEKVQLQDINAIEVILGSYESTLPDDLVFEIESQTESDDGSDGGAIYAISYPAPEARHHNIVKQQYQGKILFPVCSTPIANLDLTGIEIEPHGRGTSYDLEAPPPTREISEKTTSVNNLSEYSGSQITPDPSVHENLPEVLPPLTMQSGSNVDMTLYLNKSSLNSATVHQEIQGIEDKRTLTTSLLSSLPPHNSTNANLQNKTINSNTDES